MPRQKRDDYAGARHHVMSRGVRHGTVFYSDAYCIRFLEILEAVAELTGAQVKHLKAAVPRRTGNAPRALALWWLVFGAGLGTGEAGRKLGMTPSAASQSLSRWKSGKASYRSDELWQWRRELEHRKM